MMKEFDFTPIETLLHEQYNLQSVLHEVTTNHTGYKECAQCKEEIPNEECNFCKNLKKKKKENRQTEFVFSNMIQHHASDVSYCHALNNKWSKNKTVRTKIMYEPHLFKIVFNNAQSVHAHFQELRNDPNIKAADIVAFAESRLKPSDPSQNFSLPGFQLIRHDQLTNFNAQRPPHGLIMFIRENVRVLETELISYDNFEAISAYINPSTTGLILHLLIVYVSPTCKWHSLKCHLSNCLSTYDLSEHNIIIGDFNMKSVASGDNYNSKLEQFMSDFNFSQLVVKETTDYHSKLDLVFTNNPLAINTVDVIDNYWSDHKLIYTAVASL